MKINLVSHFNIPILTTSFQIKTMVLHGFLWHFSERTLFKEKTLKCSRIDFLHCESGYNKTFLMFRKFFSIFKKHFVPLTFEIKMIKIDTTFVFSEFYLHTIVDEEYWPN